MQYIAPPRLIFQLHCRTLHWTRPIGSRHRHLATFQPLSALPHYQIARKDFSDAVKEQSRFPWRDEFELAKGTVASSEDIIRTLEPLMTSERANRMQLVAAKRTFDCLPILEHPYDLGNMAAVCRSAEALGFGAVHVIRKNDDGRYKQSTRTSGGAEKWLDLQLFDSTEECLYRAKRLGFQILVANLQESSVSPADVDWTRPTAFVMGNELSGPTSTALEMADGCIAIPMDGFVESFNVSVAASLIMWEARRVRLEKTGKHGNLTEAEQRILLALMFLRGKGMSRQYASELLKRLPPAWQLFRKKGGWEGKTFSSLHEQDITTLRQNRCQFWDGYRCWGEELGIFTETCRYQKGHIPGFSTLNREKLRQVCEKKNIPMPEQVDHSHSHECSRQDMVETDVYQR